MQKRYLYIIFTLVLLAGSQYLQAQCSICTKTASQLGQGPARALNSAIVYLAAAPICIMGVIGYRWWKSEKKVEQ